MPDDGSPWPGALGRCGGTRGAEAPGVVLEPGRAAPVVVSMAELGEHVGADVRRLGVGSRRSRVSLASGPIWRLQLLVCRSRRRSARRRQRATQAAGLARTVSIPRRCRRRSRSPSPERPRRRRCRIAGVDRDEVEPALDAAFEQRRRVVWDLMRAPRGLCRLFLPLAAARRHLLHARSRGARARRSNSSSAMNGQQAAPVAALDGVVLQRDQLEVHGRAAWRRSEHDVQRPAAVRAGARAAASRRRPGSKPSDAPASTGCRGPRCRG